MQPLGAGQQRLGGDTADVEAGAAELILLDQGDLRAELAGADRGDVAAGPAPDHHDVELLGHWGRLLDEQQVGLLEDLLDPA